ncbi:protein eyes shut [Cydia amplana]|uniref:protein eyes shut n=1 Tax=Cydia amplana TaxID=1869771 RepID=UPI002FE56504
MFGIVSRAVQVVTLVVFCTHSVTGGIACLGNPCLHGICIDDVNSTYSCYCVDGYTGVQCQTNWDECWSAPCQNGGTCLDGIASYNCSCPDGFIGDNCETNFNECESNPCLNNGTCIDLEAGYLCACGPGFAGEHCELDVAVCNSSDEARCHNGGHCREGPGFKFYCTCTAGWAGPRCDFQIDECESNPCQNGGVCIDAHADYMCACAYGFTGKSCETQIEFCDANSCSNNALCVVEDGFRVCYCVPDYHGERCELQYDECELGPRCMNGGTCIDGIDNFTCSCPPRLTGSFCECLILDNDTLDCEYVSPTPIPQSTYMSTTDVQTDTTTDSDTTTLWDYSTTTTVLPDITTTVESVATGTEEVTTQETTETTLDIDDTYTPTETDVYVTSATEIKQTIEYEDSKTEGTTAETTEEEPTEFITTVTSTEATTKLITDLATTTETITTESAVTEIVEVTTAPEMDTTTVKMFTDAPTEHPVTELASSSSATTETMEMTTFFDNTTFAYTTVQSECSESICINQGICVNTPQGIRCHCPFNYGGMFCEEKISITSAAFSGNSFVAHKLRNTTSVSIEFNSKTLITDGQLMHVDIAKGVYVQLYMNSGLLKFKFSCGYQTMLLSELKTYVNKGYPMKIEARLDLFPAAQHCNATLRLNDTVAMSGGQVARVAALDNNTMLYFGNMPHANDTMPFVGCIWDLMVNAEKREVFGEAMEASDVSECSSLACLSGPCLNGGSCSDQGEGYTCSCANGWLGPHCEMSVCAHNPCRSGGSCVPHPGSGFLCLCPYGKHGIFCEYNVEITRPSLAPISSEISSYLIYPLSQASSERFDLRLRFQTTDTEQIALLAFVGQGGRHDAHSHHLALTFVKGYVMLTWNMGGGPRRVFTARALSPRRGGHVVRVWRRGRSAGLSVDGRHNATGNAPAHDAKMTVQPYVYIGGHPSLGFRDLPHDLPLHGGWRGCVWEVSGQAVGAGKALGGRGVGQCGVAQCTAKSCNAPRGVCIHSPATYGCICNEGWFGATCASSRSPCDRAVSQCHGECVFTADRAECDCPYGKTGTYCDKDLIPTDVYFTGTRSYVKLKPQAVSSVSLALEAEIKPDKERGLIAFVETPHFYTALSLQGGLLEYRWTDRLSGVTSLARSGTVVALNAWHSVKAGRYGSRLYVWADGALATEPLLAHAYPHTAHKANLLLGGAQDLATLPFDVMSGPPEPFTGCIRNLHVNNVLLPLESQHILAGQNLGDCDGTACGAEACSGSSCVVEAGRARCVCAGAAGGRCRRHAACSKEDCKPPAGKCRGDKCVCASGYAGFDCQLRVNVTIPQFAGDSLLYLGRRSAAPRVSEQRLNSASKLPPRYVTLNFTTAEPAGLLLSVIMDTEYLGFGLEHGYLKLAWSSSREYLTQSATQEWRLPKPLQIQSKLLPRAGFLADGEWHVLMLRLDKANMSVVVDQNLVYNDELALNESIYDDVELFIGGINEEDSAISKKAFPHNFKGCIDNIATKEESYLIDYNEIYSENIKSCQLFPSA